MERAGVGRAIAEIGHCHIIGPSHPLRQRGTDRDRDAAANDAVRAEEPVPERADLMLARHAFAVSRGAAEKLGEKQTRIEASGKRVPRRAMMAADYISRSQFRGHSDGDRFLSHVRAGVSWNEPLLLQHQQPLIEAAQQQHPPQQIQWLRRGSSSGGHLRFHGIRLECHP